ncbi:MAG TPA: hypothetical protein VHL30_02555 [Chlamydiales bacterium]|jgi:hypothetical protein|nr:hypothetical protein [Chlamydiales bacterium]
MKKWVAALIILAGILFCFPYLASVPPFKQITLLVLEKKLDAKLNVTHFRLSWLGPQRGIGVKFKTDQLDGFFQEIDANSPLWSIRKDFTLTGGSIQVPENGTSLENIQLEITGSRIDATGTTRAQKETGKFSISGTAVSSDEFKLAFDITKMPTAVVEWFLKAKGVLQAIVGPSFDLKGTASTLQKTGKISIDLSSPTASTSVNAAIHEDSITLQKTLLATLNITPEMSLVLTQNKVAVTGKDPIVLILSPEDFYLPRPFSWEKLRVGIGRLSLGRIQLQQADYLSGLAIFLKTKKLDTNQVDAWIGYADFSIENGVVALDRVDALFANSIHLCGWGQTDFIQQTLDMTLGVPADTLAKSFGIRSVSSKYALQIPLTGTYQEPQLDTPSATAKIAAIIAAGKLQKQKGIVGGIAGVINQAAQEKSPPPVSPYPPFPWDK